MDGRNAEIFSASCNCRIVFDKSDFANSKHVTKRFNTWRVVTVNAILEENYHSTPLVWVDSRVLVADGAEAITNGFRNVFWEEFVRVYCWFHVMKKLKEALTQVATNKFGSTG